MNFQVILLLLSLTFILLVCLIDKKRSNKKSEIFVEDKSNSSKPHEISKEGMYVIIFFIFFIFLVGMFMTYQRYKLEGEMVKSGHAGAALGVEVANILPEL